MVFQTMIELGNPFDAYARQLGHCLVMFMIAGSNTSNPQFTVRMYKSGEMRTVDQNDLIMYGNPGNSDDVFVPKLPDGWEVVDMEKQRYYGEYYVLLRDENDELKAYKCIAKSKTEAECKALLAYPSYTVYKTTLVQNA